MKFRNSKAKMLVISYKWEVPFEDRPLQRIHNTRRIWTLNENMKKHEIDALVIIGGDGSLTGARIFAQEFDVPCIGLPGTIDNDLYGTGIPPSATYSFEHNFRCR